MRFETVYDIPDWAACYLAYGDCSGLEPGEKEMVDAYRERLYKEGLRLVHPREGTENEFNVRPAFGLACATTDWWAEILEEDEDEDEDDTDF